ncbi:MAG: hypothetical protein K6F99_01140 [Lachnospiraceae bacterium]|nr:hypothetical protein [Lachnospiraceae bacterium]
MEITLVDFNWIRAVGEGILMALILGIFSKRFPDKRLICFAVYIILEIVSVVTLYGGQEESALFFIHPFLVFFIINLSDYAVYRRGCGEARIIAAEKLLLWPFVVIPVMSGFVLTVGWLIKLYGRYIF